MGTILKTKDLTKKYDNRVVVDNLNISIEEGEIFGLLGPNGAGKTTSVKVLTTMMKPSSGKIRINSVDTQDDTVKARSMIGVVQQHYAMDMDISVRENIICRAVLHKIPMKEAKERMAELCDAIGLTPYLDKKGNELSGGWKRKTAIVCALMHDPKILLFDEPTTGLDPLMRDSFMQIVKEEHGKGKTIIMSSHMFDELEEYSDRVGLIVNGKIIDIADLDEIRNTSFRIYKVEFKKEEEFKKFLCNSKANIIREQTQYNQVTVRIDMNDLSSFMKEVGTYNIRYIREVKYNLESYFEEHLGLFEEKAGNGNVDKQTII